MSVCLVSCVSKKVNHKEKAKDLYISPWFIRARRYAELYSDRWYILSAKYGLVCPNEILNTYELSIRDLSIADRNIWGNKVVEKLYILEKEQEPLQILAGKIYRKYLCRNLHNYTVPMRGLGIGQQLKWLNEKINKE